MSAWSGSPHPPAPAPAWSDPFQTPVSSATLRCGEEGDPRGGGGVLRAGSSCPESLLLSCRERGRLWGAETPGCFRCLCIVVGGRGRARCPLPVSAPRVLLFSLRDVVKGTCLLLLSPSRLWYCSREAVGGRTSPGGVRLMNFRGKRAGRSCLGQTQPYFWNWTRESGRW